MVGLETPDRRSVKFDARPCVLRIVGGGLVGALGVAILLACPSRLAAQLPQTRITAISPAGGQAGQAVDVQVTGGQDLVDLDRMLIAHPGITAEPKKNEDGSPVANTFTVTIAADVPPGLYDVRVGGLWGVSNPRAFHISPRPSVAEAEGNNTPAEAQQLPVGHVVSGAVNGGGDVDYFAVDATAGQRIVIDCIAQRLDSQLNPILELYDPSGRLLRSVRSVGVRDAATVLDVAADGRYLIAVHDEIYGGGNEYLYRLDVHTGPHVVGVFPAAGQAGQTGRFQVYGYNLPGDQRLEQPVSGPLAAPPLEVAEIDIAVPATPDAWDATVRTGPVESGADFFAWRMETPAGSTKPVRIGLSPDPVLIEHEPNDEPDAAQPVSTPVQVAGRFQQPGDTDWFVFDAKQGEVYWVEAIAQRLGSEVDPYFTVEQVTTNDKGEQQVKALTTQDDLTTTLLQNQYDTKSDDAAWKLEVPADGRYRVAVRDRYGSIRGGPTLTYQLAIRPERPDFRIVAVPQPPAAGQSWPVGMRKGDTFAVDVLAFRQDGFDGPITINVENLPAGVVSTGTSVGTGETSAPLVFEVKPDAAGSVGDVSLTATASIADPVKERAVAAAEAAVTAAEKPIADLEKQVAPAAQKLQEAQTALEQAQKAAAEAPDDAGKKQQLEAAQKAFDAAKQTHDQAVAAVNEARQQLTAARQAHEQAVAAAKAAIKQVTRPVRVATYAWSQNGNYPPQPRLADSLTLSVMEETAPFAVELPGQTFEVNQNRQVLIPVKLRKSEGFDNNVTLNPAGLPKNSNIDFPQITINKGQSEQLVRVFIKDNVKPGTYTAYYKSQGQVSYRRNPQKADRLKQEAEAAAEAAKQADEALKQAQQAKAAAVKSAADAANLVKTKEAERQQAEQAANKAAADLQTAMTALTAAEQKLTETAKQVEQAQQALTAAEQSATAAPDDEAKKQELAAAQKALQDAQAQQQAMQTARDAAQQAADTAKQAADAAAAKQQAAIKALADAQAAAKTAAEAQAKQEAAEKQATAAKQAADTAKQNADKAAQAAANEANPKNINFTPPSPAVVFVVKPAPVKVTASVPDGGNIKRGASVDIPVKIERQNGFSGPVTLTLPLPPGVQGLSAAPVTIAADQTEATLSVTAAGDATEGAIGNLVIRAGADFLGESAVDAPITLKVAK